MMNTIQHEMICDGLVAQLARRNILLCLRCPFVPEQFGESLSLASAIFRGNQLGGDSEIASDSGCRHRSNH